MSILKLALSTFLLSVCNVRTLQLTGNRCLLSPNIALEPSSKQSRIVAMDTGMVSMMKLDLDSLLALDDLSPPGQTQTWKQDKYYCANIKKFSKFGDGLKPSQITKVKDSSLTHIFEIMFHRASTLEYCSWDGQSLSKAQCEEKLSEYSSAANYEKPTFPAPSDTTNYNFMTDENQFKTFPL